jgi:hypothetical protein
VTSPARTTVNGLRTGAPRAITIEGEGVALCTRDNDPPAHLPTAAGTSLRLICEHLPSVPSLGPSARTLVRPRHVVHQPSLLALPGGGLGPLLLGTVGAPPVAGLLTFAGRFTPKLAGELEHAQPVNSHATRRALVAPLLATLAATLIPTGARIPPSDSRGQGGGPAADPFFGFSRPRGWPGAEAERRLQAGGLGSWSRQSCSSCE